MSNNRPAPSPTELAERRAVVRSPELVGDWLLLRSAVKTRLRTSVSTAAIGDDALTRLCACVLECVAALDQLDLALLQDLTHGGCFELAPLALTATTANKNQEGQDGAAFESASPSA